MWLDEGVSSAKKKALSLGILIGGLGGLILGFGGGYALLIHSGKPATISTKEASHLIFQAGHGQLTMKKLLPNPPGALPGSVPAEVSIDGRDTIVWIIRSGHRYVIAPGALFDEKGQDLTISVVRENIAHTNASAKANAEGATAKASATDTKSSVTGFLWGKGKTADIVFYEDPNCIFCHRQYQVLKPLVEAGVVTVRVVPVGFLKSSSAAKAAAELKGGVSAFLLDEKGFDDGTEEGALPPLSMSPDNISYFKEQMQNTQYLGVNLEGGSIGTPYLQIHTPNGWVKAEGLQTAQHIRDLIQGKS